MADAPIVSTSELARLAGKTYRTVRAALESAGVRPVQRKGNAVLYDAPRALEAVFRAGAPDHADAIAAERLKLLRAKASNAEWASRRKRQELLDLIGRVGRNFIVHQRMALQFFGARYGPEIASAVGADPVEVQHAVEDAVLQLLGELSRVSIEKLLKEPDNDDQFEIDADEVDDGESVD